MATPDLTALARPSYPLDGILIGYRAVWDVLRPG